jgi:UDP-N-acetylglucosamine 2-epimerase (non-hydrolysing)
VGNVMIDTLLRRLAAARKGSALESHGVTPQGYAVATVHRPSNVDDPAHLRTILQSLADVATTLPVVLPLHPRTAASVEAHRLDELLAPLVVTPPLGYLDMLALLDQARVVLTDSGGIQEETTALGVPCVTLREQTERPITVTEGTNRLAPWPLTREGVLGTFHDAIAGGEARRSPPEGWDGAASVRIVDALLEFRGVAR